MTWFAFWIGTAVWMLLGMFVVSVFMGTEK
jgi:hypothetical protein